MKLRLLAFVVASLSVDTFASENVNTIKKKEMVLSTSKVSVKASAWTSYLKKIVRIENVKTNKGEVIFERGIVSPYKKEIELSAPERYRIRLLCERPIRLSKKHPELDLDVDPGCNYVIDCKVLDGEAKLTVATTCGG